jgi:signal transduction histidine kinase
MKQQFAWLLLGLFLFQAGHALSQTPTLDSLRQAATQQSGAEQVITWQELAFNFFYYAPDSGGIYARKSLQAAQRLREDSLEGEAYKYLGMHAFLTAQQDSAIAFYQRAADLHEAAGRYGAEASALANLGSAYNRKGLFDKSLEAQLKAFQYVEMAGDSNRMLLISSNISELYDNIEEFDKALEYSLFGYRTARTMWGEDMPGTYMASVARSYLSFVEQDPQFLDSALLYFRLARSAYLSKQDPINFAVALNNLGYTFELAGELDSAVSAYHQAFELTRAQGQTGSATKNLANLVEGYTKLGKLPQAQRWLDSASIYVEKTDEMAPLERVYTMASRLAEAQNQPARALQWLQAALPLRDSMLNATKVQALSTVRTQYEVEKKERQIAQQQAEIAEAKRAQQQGILGSLLGLTLLTLVGALLFYRARLRQQAALEAERLHQQQLRIRETLQTQEAERSRFSRDLHDSVGQVLAATRLQFGAFSDQLKEPRYTQALETLDEACQEVRSIAHTLMPRALRDADLPAALQELLDKRIRPAGLQASLDVLGKPHALSEQQAIGAYRILQELLQNVLKHAQASRVEVQLIYRTAHLLLRVEDDGLGISTKAQPGAGIANMQLRAEAMGADLQLEPGPEGRGTSASLRLPLG